MNVHRHQARITDRNLVGRDLGVAVMICLPILLIAVVISSKTARFHLSISRGLICTLLVLSIVVSISTLVHRRRVRSRSQKATATILLAWIVILVGTTTALIIATLACESGGSNAYEVLGVVAGVVFLGGMLVTAVLFLALIAIIVAESRKPRSVCRDHDQDNRCAG
ncbi:MAG: hypothetical protein C4536_12875 [Actinobacteria bacterium]|jgi:uncharacterized membrane protein|nr:MAG: hypothetical protein C4536_12875 [Actinomycetota bacterium]